MNPHDAPWHKECTRLSPWVGRADEPCGEDGAEREGALATERTGSKIDLAGPVPAQTKHFIGFLAEELLLMRVSRVPWL